MSGLENNRVEIERIFAEAAAETSLFPAPMNEIGLAMLARCNPLHHEGGTNMISYLLPYWLGESFGSPVALCRELSVGNVYAMLHFFILDDAMDGEAGNAKHGIRESLALGQLFLGLFQQRYQRHFSSASPLWAYYRKYVAEWASAVAREGQAPANPADPAQIARKAAPVKLCVAGLLLLSDRRERIPELEEAVDLALAVLQLSDDWADWREDLPQQNCNAFLTIARERLSLPADAVLDERMVKRSIYHYGCLDRLADIAEDYVGRLAKLPFAPPMLSVFQRLIAEGLRRDARDAEELTRRLATEGGMSYFLVEKFK